MKIVGLTHIAGSGNCLYVKPDSALLVNRKPFFLPEWVGRVFAHPCLVLKINRLGKDIKPQFAYRYFSEQAFGLNMIADEILYGKIEGKQLDLRPLVFDCSMVVGEFAPVEAEQGIGAYSIGGRVYEPKDLRVCVEDAIAEVSKYVTLRMGDMVAIDYATERIGLEEEMVIKATGTSDEKDVLYCKIK